MLSSVNIENLMNEINKKIVKTKSDNEQILNFVALELSKLNISSSLFHIKSKNSLDRERGLKFVFDKIYCEAY